MKCEYCENEVPAGMSRCPSCGAAVKLSVDVATVAQPKVGDAPTRIPAATECEEALLPHKRKMKAVYVVLGFFLGAIGVHNFYAGYKRRAVAQLLITVLSFGYLLLVSWIWAIVEIIIVNDDASGRPFV